MHWQPEDESPAQGPTAARLSTSLNPPGGGRELESGRRAGGGSLNQESPAAAPRLKRDEETSATPSRISSPG